MSLLSRTTPSYIGSVYLTSDGTSGGIPIRGMWSDADWSPYRRSVGEVLASETQQFFIDVGRPVTLEFPRLWASLYWALRSLCDQTINRYAASFALEATTAVGSPIVTTFTALQWLELHYDTRKPIAGTLYPNVVATLIEED